MNSHRVNSKRPFLAYFASICHSTIIIPHCTPKIQSQRHDFVNNDNDNVNDNKGNNNGLLANLSELSWPFHANICYNMQLSYYGM